MPSFGAQVVPLAVALGLSLLVGIEREVRHKVAGLRTHALVGMGSALFMLVSKYGFNDILQPGRVVSNPGQMAGQVITGIGFLGSGILRAPRERPRHHHRRKHLGGRRDRNDRWGRPVRPRRDSNDR